MRRGSAVLAFLLFAVGCGPEDGADTDGTWVGTITTEGNVTTVVNESGSVWGGTARLVEEASIGVDLGADEYMFGSPRHLWATDEEIYVVDSQVPTVRVYDHDGTHLRDIGRRGQGPGEYLRPSGLVVDAQGRIYVRDGSGNNRINVFAPDGNTLDTWTWESQMRTMGGTFLLGHDGNIYTHTVAFPEGPIGTLAVSRPRRQRVQQIHEGGTAGELLAPPDLTYEPLTATRDGWTFPIAYSPTLVSAFTPSGAYVAGVNSAYHFEIHRPDGTIVRVERDWKPVPIAGEHAEFLRKRQTASLREADPEWMWNGPPIPAHKTAYSSFRPTQGDRLLVSSEGPSHPVNDCSGPYDMENEPCYESERSWSMFSLDGRYLGDVEFPPNWASLPFFRGDLVLMVTEDAMGTYTVKRYKLILPEDEER